MAIERNALGPLRYAGLYKINDVTFFDKTRPPKIEADSSDEDYIVRINDRLDLIAFIKYGDDSFDWVIQLRNDLRLWPNSLVPGMNIKLPTLDSLRARNII